jgi:DNA-binding LytR/AlgR family response regulator
MPSSKSVNSRQTESVVEKNVIDEMQVLAEIPLEIEIEDDTAFTKDSEDDDVSNNDDKPLIICVKSYGDYRFIEAKDICYLQADNNSTDIHLYNGEMITAFKTLKHFENVLVSPFVRIHNSYIVNIDYVSRIHTGNSVCYIKNTTTKLPFSKSYKENVDAIINSITKGNYLEI